MVGEFMKAPEGFDHLLVTIDKFTKWIEVQSIANLKSEWAAKFIQDIIHMFRVPNRIITDNDTQFIGRKFLDFYDSLRIRVDWASVYQPESNVQVERANGLILQGIKTSIYNELKIHARRWVDELPSLLWSLRTSMNRLTGYTPFFLIYRTEMVIPFDLDFDAPCVHFYDEQRAEEQC